MVNWLEHTIDLKVLSLMQIITIKTALSGFCFSGAGYKYSFLG